MEARIWSGVLVVALALAALLLSVSPVVAEEAEKVLTLDHSNFSDIVSKHDFIVVEFYAPWCGHCKSLAPEYEKAASILSSHDPPISLAKIDASAQENRELALEYQIQGFPTLKILRKGGKSIQEYNGPRDSDGIVDHLRKQRGPASTEVKSAEDAASFFDLKKSYVIGLFQSLAGEEFENYTAVAEKLRSDYDFAHTLDAKHIPKGESVCKPTMRVLNPLDEQFVDSQDFDEEALEKFIVESMVPLLTVWNNDPKNQPYLDKFFNDPSDKAYLLVNFSKEYDFFLPKYKDVATLYKGKGINLLLGDVDAAQNAFQFFGLKVEQAPVLIAHKSNGDKYFQDKIEPDHITNWLKKYEDGLVKPFVKSEPIPEVSDEPVKVVVRDSLQDVVFNSGKNVLLEFYSPWCGHCKNLAPILEEVAIAYSKDPDVIIAKFDATLNDVPRDSFDVKFYPTLYLRSAKGNLVTYEGDRTKEKIISFIEKNRDKAGAESTSAEPADADSLKDEL